MDSVFQELKHAREVKKLSILDIADATLINPSFLEAIEKGNTTMLPQTYIRAFIREYASVVGLNPAAIMQQYDRERDEATRAVTPAPPPAPVEHTGVVEPEPAPTPSGDGSLVLGKLALPAVTLLILAIVVWNLTRTKSPQTNETPFESTSSNLQADSLRKSPAATPPKSHPDSLILKATTTDSAWVQIFIDDLAPREYLFRPNRTIVWKARDKFRISVGNPTAVHLTLNEKSLGTAGKRGTIARNVELNRQTLQK